jgi:hypothetical protein
MKATIIFFGLIFSVLNIYSQCNCIGISHQGEPISRIKIGNHELYFCEYPPLRTDFDSLFSFNESIFFSCSDSTFIGQLGSLSSFDTLNGHLISREYMLLPNGRLGSDSLNLIVSVDFNFNEKKVKIDSNINYRLTKIKGIDTGIIDTSPIQKYENYLDNYVVIPLVKRIWIGAYSGDERCKRLFIENYDAIRKIGEFNLLIRLSKSFKEFDSR